MTTDILTRLVRMLDVALEHADDIMEAINREVANPGTIVPGTLFMPIADEALYREYKDNVNGYYTGAASEIQFRDPVNLARATIQVTRVSVQEGVSAGNVVDTLPRQLIADAFDDEEFAAQLPEIRESIALFLNIDVLQFTAGLKQWILGVATNATMPVSRAALIALQNRDGSRAEELQGEAITVDQSRAANAWGIANETPLW